jgi:hypothetical protein
MRFCTPRHRSKHKKLDLLACSGNHYVKRQPTWGMSVREALLDKSKLLSADSAASKEYVKAKFKKFGGRTFSKKTRDKKCIEYYNAASEDAAVQANIVAAYQFAYKTNFPKADADRILNAKYASPRKMESNQYIANKKDEAKKLNDVLAKLVKWRTDGDWQTGDNFFSLLQMEMATIDESACNALSFGREFSAACKSELTTNTVSTNREKSAKYDMMVGFKQNSKCTFDAHSENWGDINTRLEQSFETGVWSNRKAESVMTELGFTVQVQAAIAIGAQLKIEGDLSWTKGNNKLKMAGSAEVFVGAKASASAKLSVNALKGIDAHIKAGAFVGFKAEVKGSCAYSYDGQDVIRVEASASISFGVGAELDASIKAPIFGPTEISFKAGLSVGLGTSIATTASIDFDAATLAANENFRKVVYWRTISHGWDPALMTPDSKNLFYLKKCIARVGAEIEEVNGMIGRRNAQPSETQSLLMSY